MQKRPGAVGQSCQRTFFRPMLTRSTPTQSMASMKAGPTSPCTPSPDPIRTFIDLSISNHLTENLLTTYCRKNGPMSLMPVIKYSMSTKMNLYKLAGCFATLRVFMEKNPKDIPKKNIKKKFKKNFQKKFPKKISKKNFQNKFPIFFPKIKKNYA
jgi:hypothetical protein